MKVVLIVIGWMLKVAGVGLLGWLLLSGSAMFAGDGIFMLKMLWVMLRCLSKVDLKCKDVGCNNVYRLSVSGNGRGFVGLVAVSWKCNVCGRWNSCIRNVLVDVEVTV